MKKAAIIFLVFIYALSTTGFAMKADYCCNHLKSVKFVLANAAKDKEGCCKVKYQTFKVKDVHAAADVVNAPPVHFTFVHTLVTNFQLTDLVSETNQHFAKVHAPPLIASLPVYISNCVFRI